MYRVIVLEAENNSSDFVVSSIDWKAIGFDVVAVFSDKEEAVKYLQCLPTGRLIKTKRGSISDKTGQKDNNSAVLAQRVMSYVDKHIWERISLEDVSNQLHISNSQLIREFKKETGYTFLKYVTKKKMDKAAECLEKENLKVREVSERLGYCSTRHFSALFFKQFGCHPSEYFGILSNKLK